MAQAYEVMVDTWGWGDPHQFVRGDVVTEADAEGFDVDWALKMGSIRRMRQIEVDSLEANEDAHGNNPSRNPVTGLLSTVRTFEEFEDNAEPSMFEEGQPLAQGTGGGTGVNQEKLENELAGATASSPKPAESRSSSTSSAKDDDKK